MTPVQLRDDFLGTLTHIRTTFDKIRNLAGPPATSALHWADVHKLSEGLYVSAWTHWEQFLKELMVADLAADKQGALKDVKKFRTKGAPERLARLLLDHPDENKWVEWSRSEDVVARADEFLAPTHRYAVLKPHQSDFEKMRGIRNAVAHRSDVAWDKFIALVKKPPFGLTNVQGITPGRFVSSHRWGSDFVIVAVITKLEGLAKSLVP